jgi:hypothetical protein
MSSAPGTGEYGQISRDFFFDEGKPQTLEAETSRNTEIMETYSTKSIDAVMSAKVEVEGTRALQRTEGLGLIESDGWIVGDITYSTKKKDESEIILKVSSFFGPCCKTRIAVCLPYFAGRCSVFWNLA